MATRKFIAKTTIMHSGATISAGKKFELDDETEAADVEALLAADAIEEIAVKSAKSKDEGETKTPTAS